MNKNYITVPLLCALPITGCTTQIIPQEQIDLYKEYYQTKTKSTGISQGLKETFHYQNFGENNISLNSDYREKDKDIFEDFIKDITERAKRLEPEFSKIIDENFWDLV